MKVLFMLSKTAKQQKLFAANKIKIDLQNDFIGFQSRDF